MHTLLCDLYMSTDAPPPWRQAPFRKIANHCSPNCVWRCAACMPQCKSVAVRARRSRQWLYILFCYIGLLSYSCRQPAARSQRMSVHHGVGQPGSDGYRFADCAVYRTILPEMAGMFDVDMAVMRLSIIGGKLACPWHPSLLLLPAMVEDLPPLQRLVISGKHLQLPQIPPTLQHSSRSATLWLHYLTLHTTERRAQHCPASQTALQPESCVLTLSLLLHMQRTQDFLSRPMRLCWQPRLRSWALHCRPCPM